MVMKLTKEEKQLLVKVQDALVKKAATVGEMNRIREVIKGFLDPNPTLGSRLNEAANRCQYCGFKKGHYKTCLSPER